MKYFFLLFYTTTSFAFYLNTNIGAAFNSDKVKIYVTSNSTCSYAGVSKEDLLDMAIDGVNKYWNRVPTSSLRLVKGGILQTSDSKFLTEKLCAADSATSCPTATSVPLVSEIVIACNNNTTDNFPSSQYLALTAPTNLHGSSIKGSVVLINDSASSTFGNLSRDEMVSVLAHEIGHAVGLGHSDRDEALMHYLKNEDRRKLSQDDIDGISYLYPNKVSESCNNFFGLIQKYKNDPPKDKLTSRFHFVLSFILGGLLFYLVPFLYIKITRLKR